MLVCVLFTYRKTVSQRKQSKQLQPLTAQHGIAWHTHNAAAKIVLRAKCYTHSEPDQLLVQMICTRVTSAVTILQLSLEAFAVIAERHTMLPSLYGFCLRSVDLSISCVDTMCCV